MAIAAKTYIDKHTETIAKGSLALGDLVGFDGAKIAAIGTPVMGMVVELGENYSTVLCDGDIVNESGFTAGNIIYSDGDGTYSASEPAGAAGTMVWILGFARSASQITIKISSYEKGA